MAIGNLKCLWWAGVANPEKNCAGCGKEFASIASGLDLAYFVTVVTFVLVRVQLATGAVPRLKNAILADEFPWAAKCLSGAKSYTMLARVLVGVARAG